MNREAGLKYQQVAQQLLEYISQLEEGSKLPNRNALAGRFGVARTTLEHAIADLIAQRYLVARDGSGTYVATRRGLNAQTDRSSHRWLTLGSDMAPLQPNSWALLLSNILYDIYPAIVRAVQDEVARHDINLIVCNTDNSIDKQEDLMYRLALNGISGMIVVPAIGGVNNPMVVPALTAVGIHVVSCFRPLVNHFMPGAYGNSFQAGYIGTKHLLERGCRKIAFFSSPMYQGAYERYQGYLTALRERGGEEAEPLLSCETSFQYEQGLDAAARLLEEEPDMDSIFAFNDRIAREAYGLLARHGRRPGRDVLLVGCDNTGICNELSPKLSSISYPLQQIGQSSARMLWQLASASREEGSRLDIFGCSLIARESSVSDGPQPSA